MVIRDLFGLFFSFSKHTDPQQLPRNSESKSHTNSTALLNVIQKERKKETEKNLISRNYLLKWIMIYKLPCLMCSISIKVQLIEKAKQQSTKKADKQTINISIPVMMCLNTEWTAPAGASWLFHFKAPCALQQHTFITEQWDVMDSGRKRALSITHTCNNLYRHTCCTSRCMEKRRHVLYAQTHVGCSDKYVFFTFLHAYAWLMHRQKNSIGIETVKKKESHSWQSCNDTMLSLCPSKLQ